jgi:hypothetical protein
MRRDHVEDPGIDWRKILSRILGRLSCGNVNWINLTQDRDQWLVLVNTVMNLHVLLNVGNVTM